MENRRQKIAPFSSFLIRLGRYLLFSLALIFFSVVIGTAGYHYLAQLHWLDSFHMACMILTGMGPVMEMKTDAAKLFSSFYALYSGNSLPEHHGCFLCTHHPPAAAYPAR